MANTILFIFLLVVIFFAGKWLIDFSDRKRLVYGKKKTKTALLGFSKSHGFKLFSNISVNIDGEKIHFDNLIVGFFGLLAVNVLEPQGEYCGEEGEDKWVFTKDSSRDYIENPINQNSDALQKLKKALGKEAGVYKLNANELTVFGGKPSKTQVYTKAENKVCFAKDLGKVLKDKRFSDDNGVDVEKVCDFIMKNLA